jgi:excisionase family DNA binding protein
MCALTTLDAENLVNFKEAASILKVTRATIYAMVRRGELHPITIADRSYLDRAEVEKRRDGTRE